jgi:hypothetical protein
MFHKINESNVNITFDEYNGKLTLEKYIKVKDCSAESQEELCDRDWYKELSEEEKSAVGLCFKDKLECYEKLRNRMMGPSLN